MVLVAFFALVIVVVGQTKTRAVTFSTPVEGQPIGNISPYIVTSNAAQTKYGGLVFGNGGLTVSNGLRLGGSGSSNPICWNDDGSGAGCRNSWSELTPTAGVLRLQSASVTGDLGWVELNDLAGDSIAAGVHSTVTGIAGSPDAANSTYGLSVASSTSNAGASLGIFAYSQASWTGRVGIYGKSTQPNAWAGYFSGDVAASTGAKDFVIGNSVAINNGLTELCLGGTCRSDWPNATRSPWNLNSAATTWIAPTATTATRGVSVAGIGTNPPFSLVRTLGIVHATIKGDVSTEQMVVGSPLAAGQIGLACGDGICQAASPFFETILSCPFDCDNVPPLAVEVWDAIVACRISCPIILPTLFSFWTNPPLNPPPNDYAGVRVIIRTVAEGLDPDSVRPETQPSSGYPVFDVSAPQDALTADCVVGTGYRAYFMSYDAGRNYSPAIEGLALCSTRALYRN